MLPKTNLLHQKMPKSWFAFDLEAVFFDWMFDCFLNNNFAAFNEKLRIERIKAALDSVNHFLSKLPHLPTNKQ